MKFDIKQVGLGGWFSLIALVGSVVALVGAGLMELMNPVGVLAALAAVAAAVAVLVGRDIISFATLALALAAACTFLREELYTISNELTGIDATGFSTVFILTAAALIVALVTAIAATFPRQRKA